MIYQVRFGISDSGLGLVVRYRSFDVLIDPLSMMEKTYSLSTCLTSSLTGEREEGEMDEKRDEVRE
jgi:hypothetical protein